MKQISKIITRSHGLNIMQKRSKKTYDALIKTGFRLLKKREWDSITVAELSQSAGYSVGAFYTRFRSKDEFFDALVVHHFKIRYANLESVFPRVARANRYQSLGRLAICHHQGQQ